MELAMSVSGTSTFSSDRDSIIYQAARLVNAVGLGTTMSAEMINQFAFMLNALVKAWSATGLHVWTETEAVLFPVPGQVRYVVGTGSTDNVTEIYYQTAITADEAVGQTILSVDDTSDMTVADYIGIVLDNGSVQWTTIASKTSTTVTVDDALTDGTAAGNLVFNYTSKIVRPLKITDARAYTIDSDADMPLSPISRQEYNALPQKNQAGSLVEFFYDPQRTLGYIYLWQVPATLTDLVKFTWHRPIMDFNTAADDIDLPSEWVMALVFNLADVMKVRYSVQPKNFNEIARQAAVYLDMVRGFDRENESVFVQPETDM
jgi:hypothetical protein